MSGAWMIQQLDPVVTYTSVVLVPTIPTNTTTTTYIIQSPPPPPSPRMQVVFADVCVSSSLTIVSYPYTLL